MSEADSIPSQFAAEQYELVEAPAEPSLGRAVDTVVGPSRPPQILTQAHLGMPRRRVWLPLLLFVVTIGSTFVAGASRFQPDAWLHDQIAYGRHWLNPRYHTQLEFNPDLWSARSGWIYMSAVMAILLTHEMGHFLQSVRYRVAASFPYFIPMPFSYYGTMGAVIAMDGAGATRKQIFDIGISGPLAGLLVALPVSWYGIQYAHFIDAGLSVDGSSGNPLIFHLFIKWLHPELGPGHDFILGESPLAAAGWLGMMVTGLNMLPMSQLDGGHVIYGLFGRDSQKLARLFFVLAVSFVAFSHQFAWVLMLFLIYQMGLAHPPALDDATPLSPGRRMLGFCSLIIPVFCLAPFIT